MDEFPFTEEEWEQVSQSGMAIGSASMMDDAALGASHFVELQAVLHDLRKRYGRHPVLLETEADFCHDPGASCALYAEALQIARDNQLPLASICISYASTLIDRTDDFTYAKQLLELCRAEALQEESLKREWDELNNRVNS